MPTRLTVQPTPPRSLAPFPPMTIQKLSSLNPLRTCLPPTPCRESAITVLIALPRSVLVTLLVELKQIDPQAKFPACVHLVNLLPWEPLCRSVICTLLQASHPLLMTASPLSWIARTLPPALTGWEKLNNLLCLGASWVEAITLTLLLTSTCRTLL